MKTEISKKLEKAIARVLLYFEEFGYIVLQWNIKEDKSVPAMATDYEHLFFNPSIVERLNINELCAVLLHEILHVIFLHPTEIDKIFSEGKDPVLWNIAQEMVVNAEVQKLIKSRKNIDFILPGVPISPFKGILLKKSEIENKNSLEREKVSGYWYDEEWADKTSFEIYNALEKFSKEQKENLKKMYSNIFGNDIKPCKDRKIMREAIERIIAVYKKAMQKKGDLPLGIKRQIMCLMESRVPWYRILQAFINKFALRQAENFYWNAPNFRHPLARKIIVPGYVKEEIEDVVVVIDTSGSISNYQLERFVSELIKIKSYIDEIIVYTTDAKIHEKIKIKDLKEILFKIEFKGGGGTDFYEVFKEVKKCACMIFFTDGYATYPETVPKYPVLWILTKNSQKRPWGKVAYILDV